MVPSSSPGPKADTKPGSPACPSSPTRILKGLPGIWLPLKRTSIEWTPFSLGMNLMACWSTETHSLLRMVSGEAVFCLYSNTLNKIKHKRMWSTPQVLRLRCGTNMVHGCVPTRSNKSYHCPVLWCNTPLQPLMACGSWHRSGLWLRSAVQQRRLPVRLSDPSPDTEQMKKNKEANSGWRSFTFTSQCYYLGLLSSRSRTINITNDNK